MKNQNNEVGRRKRGTGKRKKGKKRERREALGVLEHSPPNLSNVPFEAITKTEL